MICIFSGDCNNNVHLCCLKEMWFVHVDDLKPTDIISKNSVLWRELNVFTHAVSVLYCIFYPLAFGEGYFCLQLAVNKMETIDENLHDRKILGTIYILSF